MEQACSEVFAMAGAGAGHAMVAGNLYMALRQHLRGIDLAIAPGERDYGEYLDYTYHADATITFPQTVYMRFCLFEKDKGLQEAGHAYAKWFHKRLVKVEQRLEGREFLCADRFTVADICVGYALILAQSVGLDDGVPDSLKAYRARLTAREAYRRAFEREEEGRKALERPAG